VTSESASGLIEAMGHEGDRVAMRLARGCRAFAKTVNGEVVAYGWISTGREWVGELSMEIVPAAGEAYVWNCVTLEPHRRRGHYRDVLEGIVSVARSEGFRRLWIGSVDVPAEKADSDAGFVRVLRFDVIPEGGRRRLTVKGVRGADDRLVEEARARLGVRGGTHVGPSETRLH
jgi:GNAT superfamily N-acetyltransferase